MNWQYQTLVEALEAAAKQTSARRGYTFLEGSETEHLSFEALWRNAKIYASALQHRGVQKGDRVLVVMPTSAEFASIYMALLLCGAAPCVLPSPENLRHQNEAVGRILNVAGQLEATLLITNPESGLAQSELGASLQRCTVADLHGDTLHGWQPVALTGNDLALIQASSGTTGKKPKCIALSHSNILANLQQIGQRLQTNDDDVVVCWLPLFHDMGLIGCFLFVLYWQLEGVFMTPYRFLRRPGSWLKAISDYGGTLSPAPNFAYALAVQRTTDRELAGLDLSTWRGALCGAEQIDVKTLQRFVRHFAPYGFRESSLVPCYGMAEASLCVVMHSAGQPFNYEQVSRTALTKEGLAFITDQPDADDTTLVCDCGAPVDGTQIQIRSESGSVLGEGYVGSVWISGPSITRGYYNAPDETGQVIQGSWLNTGDLGYIRHGHLFITGRSKDLIVIRGHNYQPTDFEWAAAEVPGVADGRVVAFGVYDPEQATEKLYLVCERPRKLELSENELLEAIKLHVGRQTGILPAQVGLVTRNTIPKTTSGKIQRARTKSLYFKLKPGEVTAL